MIHCPKCNGKIAEEDFNVSTDYACCRQCDKVYRFSELAEQGGDSGIRFDQPPPGIRIYDNGLYELLRFRHYSGTAWFFLFFSSFWCTITVVVSSAIILQEGIWGWHTLFFVPFYLIGIGTAFAAVYSFWGRSEARFTGDALELWSGIGVLGIRRRLEPGEIQKVEVRETGASQNRSPFYGVYLHSAKGKKKFCSSMDRDKMEFVAAYLRRKLKKTGAKR